MTPGYDTLDDYLADPAYFGAIIGRYANRIDEGRFVIDGVEYHVAVNKGNRTSCTAARGGFHSMLWNVELHNGHSEARARAALPQPGGRRGFPREHWTCRVTYT